MRAALALVLCLVLAAPAPAQQRRSPPPAPETPAPQQEAPPPPYEQQLLRLSEVMGALSFLRDLCGHKDGGEWRARMAALLSAEAETGPRKERLAGAYNRGYRGFELTYRTCTPAAELAMSRYFEEGGRLAREITRFGG